LEKKKLDGEAWGEIETAHPGYLGSQNTFYVVTLKGQITLDQRHLREVPQNHFAGVLSDDVP
tara:strand:+ start:270 stop:455 length:186 start_codon:yes stop_codon:yes gene_type:complete